MLRRVERATPYTSKSTSDSKNEVKKIKEGNDKKPFSGLAPLVRDEGLKKKLRILTYVTVVFLLILDFMSMITLLAILGGFLPSLFIEACNIVGLGLLMRFKVY